MALSLANCWRQCAALSLLMVLVLVMLLLTV